MKKQINPTIKAHLIRSAFYVILLLAVCVIPFALAQRNTTKRSPARPKQTANLAAAGHSAAVPSSGAALPLDKQALIETKRAAAAARKNIGAPASLAGAKRQPDLRNPPASYRPPSQPPAQAHSKATRLSKASGLVRRSGPSVTGPNGTGCVYNFTVGTDTFVPGVDDTGNHGDDVGTVITLPFSVTLYGQTFTSATVGSNGHMTFGTAQNGFGISCSPFGISGATDALAPYWGDQCTGACFNTPCNGCGIFTTTTGSAPNRIFYVEYRTNYYGLGGQNQDLLDYEIALHEDGNPPFEFIYNNIEAALVPNDSELVVGHKQDDGCFTEYGVCDTSGGQSPPVTSGMALFAAPFGVTPTPTPTAPPLCGLLVGSGMTTGFLPNGWEPTLASNTVN